MVVKTLSPPDMKKIIPLVTGGGSGIGLGLVKEFIQNGSPKVLITGRREAVLKDAVGQFDQGTVHYKVSDAGKASDREGLLAWVKAEHPDCSALVNNAGIQRRVPPVDDTATPWEERAQEIEINVSGPIHLCTLFIPFFLEKKPEPCMLINITSGLAHFPVAGAPVYGATKAAMHSYSMALRYSLDESNIRLIELCPPAVKSNLGGSHDFGEECDEYCAAAMAAVLNGEQEKGFNMSENARLADRETRDNMADMAAERMNVPKF